MEKFYLSENDYGCKSIVFVFGDIDDTCVISELKINKAKTGYCIWNVEKAVTTESKEKLTAELLENETSGYSCGVYDTINEVCNDLSFELKEEDKAYFDGDGRKYFNIETGKIETEESLLSFYLDMLKWEPEVYGDMSFNAWLSDCTGKNGALIEIVY